MKNLTNLYRNLTDKLAVVLAHPQTPETFRHECGFIVRPLAFHAGVELGQIAATRAEDVESRDFRRVALEFGLAAAAVMEAPDADEFLCDALAELTLNMEHLVKPEGCSFGARLRGILTAYAGLTVEPIGEGAAAVA